MHINWFLIGLRPGVCSRRKLSDTYGRQYRQLSPIISLVWISSIAAIDKMVPKTNILPPLKIRNSPHENIFFSRLKSSHSKNPRWKVPNSNLTLPPKKSKIIATQKGSNPLLCITTPQKVETPEEKKGAEHNFHSIRGKKIENLPKKIKNRIRSFYNRNVPTKN